MVSVHNYFRRLRNLKAQSGGMLSIQQELSEIFRELPVSSTTLVEKIIEDERVDTAEIKQIRTFIYQNGKPGSDEIRLLFEIHDHVYGNKNDPSWGPFFLDETTRYFTENSNEKRKLSFVKASMLCDQIKKTITRIGLVSEMEMALLKNLIERVGDLNSIHGPKLFLSELFNEVLQDEKIDFNEVSLLKDMISQNTPPLEEDIELLFDINLAITDKPKDEYWKELFVESISFYLIHQSFETSHRSITWLENKLHRTIEKQQRLTPEEVQLMCTLKNSAREFPPDLNLYWMKYCQ